MNFKYDSIELVNDNNKKVLIEKESRKIISRIKNISFKVEARLHKKVKLKATESGIGIKEYVISLLKADLKK